jgi:hypothetical protein
VSLTSLAIRGVDGKELHVEALNLLERWESFSPSLRELGHDMVFSCLRGEVGPGHSNDAGPHDRNFY